MNWIRLGRANGIVGAANERLACAIIGDSLAGLAAGLTSHKANNASAGSTGARTKYDYWPTAGELAKANRVQRNRTKQPDVDCHATVQ